MAVRLGTGGVRNLFCNVSGPIQRVSPLDNELCSMTNHRKRPRDPAQLAKMIVDIATGEVEDRKPTPEEQGKDPAAAALGRRGGAARAKKIGPEGRAEIARKAARDRWKKD